MVDIKYKESHWDLFVEESFGKHTYTTLLLFNHNANNIKKMIELYWNLLTSDKTLNNNEKISKKESVSLKHMILLDSIAKIQSLIETLLVLIDSLEEGYSHIANNIAFYNFQKPRQIVQNLRKRKYDSKMRIILGLPDVGGLNLNQTERKILIKVYQFTIHEMKEMILNLANFYDTFRIVYGKWKHGLTFQSGSENLNPEFDNSNILVIDNKKYNDMPIGTLKAFDKNKYSLNWFNVQSVLTVNDQLFEYFKNILDQLLDVINFITNNHITYAHNCGMTYLPHFVKSKDTYAPWLYTPKNISNNEKEIISEIFTKVFNQTYVFKPNLSFFKIYNSIIKESIEKNPITNIWISDSDTISKMDKGN